MRCVGRHRLQRLRHDLGDLLVSDLAGRAAARLVIKTVKTPFGKPLSPQSSRQPGNPEFIRYRAIVQTVGGQQYNLSSHRIGPSNLSATHAHFQLASLPVRKYELHRWAARHPHLRIKNTETENHASIDMTRNF